MRSLFLGRAIILLAVLSLAAPVSAGRQNNQNTPRQDKHHDYQIERSSVYYFAGSGELTSPVPADCLDCPEGCALEGAGTTSEIFTASPLLTVEPPAWSSRINIVWANSLSSAVRAVCAPVNGTITNTFPDGSTLTAKVIGLACAVVPPPASPVTASADTESVPPLPYTCYLTARVVEGTGLYEGAKGMAKITSYIDVNGKITMIGEGTLKLEEKGKE